MRWPPIYDATNNECCESPDGTQIINCIDAPSSTDNDDDAETLTPGAIAGIAIGSLAGAVLLGYGVYRLCRRKPASSATVKVGSLLF